jgi:hypothetical protein
MGDTCNMDGLMSVLPTYLPTMEPCLEIQWFLVYIMFFFFFVVGFQQHHEACNFQFVPMISTKQSSLHVVGIFAILRSHICN